MSLCRTPVQIKTAKAKKYDAVARKERTAIAVIDHTNAGTYSVEYVTRMKAAKAEKVRDTISSMIEGIKSGDWTQIAELTEQINHNAIFIGGVS